jgi:hypothetical protein
MRSYPAMTGQSKHYYRMRKITALLFTAIFVLELASCNKTSTTETEKDTLQAKVQRADTATSSLIVQYVVSDTYPMMEDSAWKPLSKGIDDDLETSEAIKNQPLWIRVADSSADPLKWNIHGPLRGDHQIIDVTKVVDKESSGNYFEIQAKNEKDINKGLKCCKVRVKVRVRVVTKKPEVTVRNPKPEITVNWRKPIPSVTVKGPDIIVKDLPELPSIDSPIPTDGTPNIGMKCEIINGNAILFIQNAESKPVDVWIIYKGINVGPSRIEPNSMRSLGETGYSNCEIANENIYITKATFPGGW